MNKGNITEQIEGTHQQGVSVLDDLMVKTGELELADPPVAPVRYRQKLRENAYKVLVVGETKKSTRQTPIVAGLPGLGVPVHIQQAQKIYAS